MDEFQKLTEEIKMCEAKIRDNCDVISQLKKEDVALRNTVKLLKRKRFEVAIGQKDPGVSGPGNAGPVEKDDAKP